MPKINRPGDQYEREADRLTEHALSMPAREGIVPGQEGERKKKDEDQAPPVSSVAPMIQRQAAWPDVSEDEIERRLEAHGVLPRLATGLASSLHTLLGSGQPFPDNLRVFFEPRLGVDLSRVRVHTGSVATLIAALLNAKAFTVGQEIVFGAGEYNPNTPEGQRLLAHELAHVAQQNGQTVKTVAEQPSETAKVNGAAGSAAAQTGRSEAAQGVQTAGQPAAPQSAAQTGPQGEKEGGQKAGGAAAKKEAAVSQPAGSAEVGEAGKPKAESPPKAPQSPEEDRQYQAVVKQVGKKSKQQKTPPLVRHSQVPLVEANQIKRVARETSEVKKTNTLVAAQLPSDKFKQQANQRAHLDQLAQNATVQPDFTMDRFMSLFEAAIDKLAPKNREERRNIAKMVEKRITAKQELASQNQALAKPYRTPYQDKPVEVPQAPDLKRDAPGGAPAIKGVSSAAPKPKTEAEISLDDKSKELDDTLKNHNVAGQKINVQEDSLPLPVSGEPSFDEADRAKREAQDRIEKAGPRYREAESRLIGKAQAQLHSMVSGGLKKEHAVRSGSFKQVLTFQKDHQNKIEGEKNTVFKEFQDVYTKTKKQVNYELRKLDGIENTFDGIIKEAQDYFNNWIKQELEYIYTPGVFDYSDWIDESKVQMRIKEERDRLVKQGEHGLYASFQARNKVADESAREAFETARKAFIFQVKDNVEKKIATKVVEVLNAAKQAIQAGKQKADEKYNALSDKEKKEADKVYTAVKDQFGFLEDTVNERQGEIVNDLARTYTKSVGKLQAKFEEIKKDVLTSWWEKAWNKLKAIVNTIIDFTKRIAELLGRLAYLVGDIISSPRYFFHNLVNGIGKGFSTFVDNIGVYLSSAFFDWLRGASGITVELPSSFGAAGIFSLSTQLLGLSTATIWERMEVIYNKKIADAFRRGETVLEKGLEIFAIVKNEGLGGLWDYIRENLGTILEDTLDTIKETVLYAAIKKVIFEIGKLLIPGGGFIAITEKIIQLLQFIVEARDKILDLIEAFVDSVEMAVKGDILGIAKHVIRALTKFITIALDFLVNLFGLSNLKEKVERILNRIRQPVIKAIDWVLKKFKPLVIRMFRQRGEEPLAQERPERKQLDVEEAGQAAKPQAEETAQTDLLQAKQTVRRALDLHLPNGARQVGDIEKVLEAVAVKVKPALSDLRAEEFMPGKPKVEGAIGFKIKARLQTGKEAAVDTVRYSEKGKALSHEERWELGVKGVKRAISQLAEREINVETIHSLLPRWQEEFGFSLLLLNTDEIPWVVEGAMSRTRPVATASPRNPYTSEEPSWGPLTAQGFGTNMTINYLARDPAPGISGSRPPGKGSNAVYDGGINLRRERATSASRGRSYYVKGHLLSQKLNGPGKWENLTPLSQKTNIQHEAFVESHLKEGINHKKAFKYIVDVYYNRAKNMSLINQIRNSRSLARIKAAKEKVVVAEQYVPELLDITAVELDPATRKKKTGGLDVSQILVNHIDESSPDDIDVLAG